MKKQKPTEEEKIANGGSIERIYKHPAFAQIQINRVSGGNDVLYGSRLKHPGHVEIRIRPSELRRDLSHDWFMAIDCPMLEIKLSFSQFAEAITNMNVGMGVPCTLSRFNGQEIPDIEEIDTVSEAARQDLSNDTKQIREKLNDLKAELTRRKIPKDVISKLDSVIMGLNENLDFVQNQFERTMEKEVSRAKVDFEAFVNQSLMEKNVVMNKGYFEIQEDGIKMLKDGE